MRTGEGAIGGSRRTACSVEQISALVRQAPPTDEQDVTGIEIDDQETWRRHARISGGLAFFTGAVSLLVLIGWWIDTPTLKSVVPGYVTMKPNTALALLLGAGSVWMLGWALVMRTGGRRYDAARVGGWLGAACAAIGVITLLEYAFDLHGGFDQLLVQVMEDVGRTETPGRMAATTATTFLFLGTALVTVSRRTRRSEMLGESLLAAAIFMPLAVLIGSIYHVIPVRGVGEGLQMALHTALGCLALGIGGFAARPDWATSRMFRQHSPGGIVARRLLPLVVLAPITLGLVRLLTEKTGFMDLAAGSAAAAVAEMFFLVVVVRINSRVIDVAHTNRLRSERDRALAEVAKEESETVTARMQEQAIELEMVNQQLQERAADADEQRTALLSSEERYRALAAAVPVQVWTARSDGQLDFVNERAVAYFDTNVENIYESGWLQFVHEEDVPETVERWSRALVEGTLYEVEFRLREAATGQYRWHLARAVPMRDATGTVIGWVGSNTDVEDERQARRAAEEASRAKSEFLAVMSHELRTPLNAIGGYTELLELGIHGPLTDAQRAALDRIQRSQRHLLTLINGILNFAKVDSGAVEYASEPVHLDDVIRNSEMFVQPQARARSITLEVPAVPSGLVALADREKVQQVLLNLLSNAIKFTEAGGIVRLLAQRLADGRVGMAVQDTGCGIAAENQERVFAAFTQLDARLTRTTEGTGLGLSISRDLARGMRGDLLVESALEKGSTFTLVLPAAA